MRRGLLADVRRAFEHAKVGNGLDCTSEELDSELRRLRALEREVLRELRRARACPVHYENVRNVKGGLR